MHYPDRAGQPYRPSNGTEGQLFEERFCDCCKKGFDCQIYVSAFLFRVTDADYPKEWIYDPDGRPTCTAFCDKRQQDLFNGADDRPVER